MLHNWPYTLPEVRVDDTGINSHLLLISACLNPRTAGCHCWFILMTTIAKADNVNEHPNRACIVDLSIDSLVQCASFLCPRDLASMAITCKQLRDAVYCDSVWESQCRKKWPPRKVFGEKYQFLGGKKAFEERIRASQKFEFLDPYDLKITDAVTTPNHILLADNLLYVPQGATMTVYRVESPLCHQCMRGHTAQITCTRSVPSTGLAVRNKGGETGPVVITSSMDHTIRLWSKGFPVRTLRGHADPVSTLSNGLLGSQYGKSTLASGDMGGIIRLWNLSSGQKRGSSPLIRTLHGHELAVKQLVLTEYNPSLLVSAGKDLKLRVWDVTSLTYAGALVGSIKGPGVPVGLVCKESMCYVAGGSTLMSVDLRSMQTITTIEAHKCGILNFSMPASGNGVCTGGVEREAKLWDLRNVEEPYATLGGHVGDVDFVHMDHHKVVTGGFSDSEVYVWDSETGDQLNALDLSHRGLTAWTVQGTRIATALFDGIIQYRDYSNCAVPIRQATDENNYGKEKSKFWETSFMDLKLA